MTAPTHGAAGLGSVVQGVRIAAISGAMPANVEAVEALAATFGAEITRKIQASTGVAARHVSAKLCSSDLCLAAAEQLFAQSGVARDSIDLVICVTQTPDYWLPATSCVLHGKLGLQPACATFDVNLGCSGYVYGLWLAATLIAAGGARRALLLAGDTISRLVSPTDRATALLFGDAGSATLVEADASAAPMHFHLGTDGTGSNKLIVAAGGFRMPLSAESIRRTEREPGSSRSDADLYMSGTDIFAFAAKMVPPTVKAVLESAGCEVSAVDAFVFHQANRFMLEHLAKRLGISASQLVVSLGDCGNTSCASIPLAMVTDMTQTLSERRRLVLAGFGVGFSWASCFAEVGPLGIAPPVLVPEPA